MPTSKSKTLAEIAELVGGVVRGDATTQITGVASVASAGPGDVTWIAHQRYANQIERCQASAVLVPTDFGPTALAAVLCDNVERAIAAVLGAFAPPLPGPVVGVDPTAKVTPSASLGEGVAIGEHVVIEAGASVGDQTILHAGVYIGPESTVGRDSRLWNNVVVRERCRIGDRVTIHANCVIGADGFGYNCYDGRHHKVPHLGRVTIGDDVEIGACCTVDRSKVGSTVIGPGTKIDNLVQVAHNVQVGANCLLCAQVGVAGSTTLRDNVVLGGQVGIRDNIVLHDGTMVAACSCVGHDLPPGTKVMGMPAVDSRQFLRENASMRRLPDLVSRMRDLTRRVQELEAAANDKP